MGVIWLVQTLRFLDMVMDSYAGIRALLELSFLLLPELLIIIIPIAASMGLLYTLSKLFQERELIVVRALGFSDGQISRSILLLGACLTIFLYGIAIYLVPQSFQRLRTLEENLKNSIPTSFLQPQTFKTINNTTFFVREKVGSHLLKGIFAYFKEEGKTPYFIYAEEGRIIDSADGPTIVMKNGQRQELKPHDKSFSFLSFDETFVSLESQKRLKKQEKKPHEFTTKSLLFPSPTYSLYERNRLISEGLQRLLAPLFPLVNFSIIIFFMLRVQFTRKGSQKGVILSILSLIGVQVLSIMLSNLGAHYLWTHFCSFVLLSGVILAVIFYLYLLPRFKKY